MSFVSIAAAAAASAAARRPGRGRTRLAWNQEARGEAERRRERIGDGAEPEDALVLPEVQREDERPRERRDGGGAGAPGDEVEEDDRRRVREKAHDVIPGSGRAEERVAEGEDDLRDRAVVPGVAPGIEGAEHGEEALRAAVVDQAEVVRDEAVREAFPEHERDDSGERERRDPVAAEGVARRTGGPIASPARARFSLSERHSSESSVTPEPIRSTR